MTAKTVTESVTVTGKHTRLDYVDRISTVRGDGRTPFYGRPGIRVRVWFWDWDCVGVVEEDDDGEPRFIGGLELGLGFGLGIGIGIGIVWGWWRKMMMMWNPVFPTEPHFPADVFSDRVTEASQGGSLGTSFKVTDEGHILIWVSSDSGGGGGVDCSPATPIRVLVKMNGMHIFRFFWIRFLAKMILSFLD
ncbi:hypothetical protein L1987_24080 [Smallanthus sonchifolius]|uniref:Uncharacterized protein n=1 Tax=Smallanthus sonchifolius TaxID=185202 RepID=A0ACB9IKW6_9ASTR|nr:hypothetical protein L1987_24080 [Smallanthus sonchifolius]